MTPKPLSDAVNKGFAYLINQQRAGGGWCQGGGWRMGTEGGRVEGPNVEDPADVANTCVAALALLRGGHTPRDGEYCTQFRRGLDFIVTKSSAPTPSRSTSPTCAAPRCSTRSVSTSIRS